MAQTFEAQILPDQSLQIRMDRETAELVADALDIINPDEGQHEQWARDCAFLLQSLLECFPPKRGD